MPLLGELSLTGAVLASSGAIFACVASVRFRSDAYLRMARRGIFLIAALLTFTSALLLVAFLGNHFEIAYVASYSERALPAGYKIAAFWAGQEGSLLLWAWLLAVICVMGVISLPRTNRTETAATTGVLALVMGFFASLLLFAANPFTLEAGAMPHDGRGLNPMLQDPGMIAHPPLLFIGYAGFTVPLAVLVGVLVAGRRDNHWIASIRRWVIVSWTFLTAGIVLGAWWAYVELGWGGYWAWDPVENASLLPWLTATALLHSMMAQQHRGMFKIWNASLIVLSFTLCIFGTYLTRSGVIESVHAFGGSLLGTFFLAFLVLCIAASVGLIVWRRRELASEHQIGALISREGAFLMANFLLCLMMLTTLIGTIFPLISQPLMGKAITVGPSFYNQVVLPMGLGVVALMAIGPVLAFGKAAALKIARSLIVPGALTALVLVVTLTAGLRNPWALLSTAIASLGTFAVVVDFARTTSARRRSTGESLLPAALHLIDRDHRRYGGQLAHLGLMLIVLGIAASSLFGTEHIYRELAPGQVVDLGRHSFKVLALEQVQGPNYTAVEAQIALFTPGDSVLMLNPQTRFYDSWQEQPNTEVAISSSWREDIYITLAGWEANATLAAIKVNITPGVIWIWIGGIVTSAGGLFCILPPLIPRSHHSKSGTPAHNGAVSSHLLPSESLACNGSEVTA